MHNLIAVSKLTSFDDEPRVLDLDLATWLGFTYAPEIRRLIARNRDELETFGGLCCRDINPGKQGGRPGKAYYLNEGQALVICALSKTPVAVAVRKALIEVFMAFRAGKVVHVSEHRRRLPNRNRAAAIGYEGNLALLRAFAHKPDALLEVMARILTRLDNLEAI